MLVQTFRKELYNKLAQPGDFQASSWQSDRRQPSGIHTAPWQTGCYVIWCRDEVVEERG